MFTTSDINNHVDKKKLSPERARIISYLENCLGYAVEGYPLSEEQGSTWAKSLNTQINKTRYGCYYVTLLGGFSSGKSTLINALIGQNLLPVATAPTTAVQTEIFEGEKLSFFIPMGQVEKSILCEIEKDIRHLVPSCSCHFITEFKRGNEVYQGIGAEFPDNAIEVMAKVIAEISAQKKRGSATLASLKEYLSVTSDAQIMLSLSNWPTWLKDIVLTDVPGTGSVHAYHEKIINQVIPHSQLILYILEANKIGAALDKEFCNRISNIHKRKIFYIINKADLLKKAMLDEALEDACVQVPDTDENGVKPEFLPASSLCAMEALMLDRGERTYLDIVEDEQPNIMPAMQDSRWYNAPQEERNRIVARYLSKRSQFSQLQDRIEQYLRLENKDLALAETAVKLIQTFAANYQRNSEEMNRILHENYDVTQLKKEQKDKIRLREKYKAEAESIICNFRKDLDFPTSRLYRNFPEMFEGMKSEIIGHIDAEADNPSNLDNLLDKDAAKLKELIQSHITNWLKRFEAEKNDRITEEVLNLDERLKPVIQRIIDNKLPISRYGDITTSDPSVDQSSISGVEVAGIGALLTTGTLAALALSGVGITTTWLTGSVVAVFGMPAMVFPPVAIVVAAIGFCLWFFGRRKKFELNKNNLLSNVRVEILPEIVKNIGESVHEQASAQVNKIAERYSDALNQLLTEMAQDETNIINQISAQEAERDRQIAEWNDKTASLQKMAKQAQIDLR